jgi:hypothetical protein
MMKCAPTARQLLADTALAQIPRILTLLDRNPHSPTYGCFDRNYWHYRTIDFPSGMAQELVLPLALACQLDIPDSSYHNQPAIRDWVEAGINFAGRSAHRDGSCDDYFPYERAGGAAAFSLLACVDSYTLLGLESGEALRFFERRANWLAKHHESGQLSNHQALIALCLETVSRLFGTDRWAVARDERIERVLDWQSGEGWFREYEGCDPGYHTLTLSCLARLYDMKPDARLKEALTRAVKLAAEFIHPDGSYGGEYGSRNTYNFFPHGFELAGRWLPEALAVNDRFLEGLARGLGACYEDDHIIGHHAWNYLLAWRDFVRERPAKVGRSPGRVVLEEAGIVIDRRAGRELYVAARKGGVFKLFIGDRLAASDTHLSLAVRWRGGIRNAVAHLVDNYATQVGEDEIVIRGKMGWAKQAQMTTLRLLALRLLMGAVGRIFPNVIRRVLQWMLITGKAPAPFEFTRRFRWAEGWTVIDELRGRCWDAVESAGIAGDQTSIYVAMSRTFQAGQLQPWLDLTPQVRKLKPGEPLIVERRF